MRQYPPSTQFIRIKGVYSLPTHTLLTFQLHPRITVWCGSSALEITSRLRNINGYTNSLARFGARYLSDRKPLFDRREFTKSRMQDLYHDLNLLNKYCHFEKEPVDGNECSVPV